MKQLLLSLMAALLVLTVFGCSNTQDPIQEESETLFNEMRILASAALFTETLGDIGIPVAEGSGIVAAGVGLVGDPAVVQPGTININVPGVVKQVLLFWEGQYDGSGTDDQIIVNGNTVTGTLVGGPTKFFGNAYSSTQRADITALGLVDTGMNTLTVEGMDFTYLNPDYQNNGVGMLVIYDDGSGLAEIGIKEGNDCAYYAFTPPLDTTEPQTFYFASASETRYATLILFAGSALTNRPNVIEVTIEGAVTRYIDIFQDFDGPQWDTETLTVEIPPGAMSMTVQALSETDPSSELTGAPASLTWLAAALAVPIEEEEPPLGCRVTGGGVDASGNWDGTFARGQNGNRNMTNRYQFGGQAGANTALPPQPRGEWTHHQQKGPYGSFVFHAGTASAPEGTEIAEITCYDPGNCSPAREAPAKQIDFAGVGVFKNIKQFTPALETVVVGETLHWFEVNIDDLGEPGKGKPEEVDGAYCPENGFGVNGEPGDGDEKCDCPDFYRIKIYAGPTNLSDVIYEVYGYVDGGNLQIHPLTGFDTH
jgi:hypothetical protein